MCSAPFGRNLFGTLEVDFGCAFPTAAPTAPDRGPRGGELWRRRRYNKGQNIAIIDLLTRIITNQPDPASKLHRLRRRRCKVGYEESFTVRIIGRPGPKIDFGGRSSVAIRLRGKSPSFGKLDSPMIDQVDDEPVNGESYSDIDYLVWPHWLRRGNFFPNLDWR